MGLRESKKARTHAEILSVAEALFRQHGFEDTPIRAIADSVPVSLQTLYNYFPSKESILAAIASQRFGLMAGAAEDMRTRFLEDPSAGGGQTERFLHLIRWALRALVEDRDFMRLVYLHARDVLNGMPGSAAARPAADLHDRHEDNRAVVTRMFEGMQKAGELRDDVSPEEMGDLYRLIFSDRVARWFLRDDGTLAELEASVIGGLEILFRGLRPDSRPGEKR